LIKSIEIEGFRSLKSTRLDLRPLNVLIGPNQSGKTNFLDALDLLSRAAGGELETAIQYPRGGFSNLLWSGKGTNSINFFIDMIPTRPLPKIDSIALGFSLSSVKSGYVIDEQHVIANDKDLKFRSTIFSAEIYNESSNSLSPMDSDEIDSNELVISHPWRSPEYQTLRRVKQELESILVYPGFETKTRWASEHPNDTPQIRQPQFVMNTRNLEPLGGNLVNVLYTMSQDDDDWEEFKGMVRTGFPDFQNIAFPADAGQGRIGLAWVDRRFPKKPFMAEVLSAGTLCFLAWAAALAAPESPSLIAIDEPEQHLHPELLYRLVGLIEQASSKHQIIVTTHSDAILSYLTDPTCVVLVDNGSKGTTMTRPSEPDLREWLKTYHLGQLRESGHLSSFVPTET
jgi:predicted ATPase